MNSIEELSNKEFSEMVQWFDIRRLSSGSNFHTWQIACMRESVRAGHDIDIHIEICIFYMNECE